MLTEGGPWRLDERRPWHYDFYRTSAHGERHKIRTTPERVEYYPGEFSEEPDPAISNVKWTGQLINFMAGQGFSLERIEAHLSDPRNLGGAFYRHKRHTDPTMLSRYYERSIAICNTDPLGTCITDKESPTGAPDDTVGRVGATSIYRRHVLELLAFIRRNPASIQQKLIDDSRVHPRAVRPVLSWLLEEGLIRRNKTAVVCAGGRKRNLWVYSVTPAAEGLLPSANELPPEVLQKLLD